MSEESSITQANTGDLNFSNRVLPKTIRDWVGIALCIVASVCFFYNQFYWIKVSPNQWQPGLINPQRDRNRPLFNYNDFRHIWMGALLLEKGGNPYKTDEIQAFNQTMLEASINPYVYPAFNGIVVNLLMTGTYSEYPALHFIRGSDRWTLLSYVFLFIILLLIFLYIPYKYPYEILAGFILILAFSFPLYRTLSAGQHNVIVLLVYTIGAVCVALKRFKLLGAWAAFGAWFKVTPGIIFLYLLATKRFKAALVFVLSSIVIVGHLLFKVGWEVLISYWPLVRQMGYGKSTWAELGMQFHIDPFNQSINALLLHLFSENDVTVPWINLGAGMANGLSYLIGLSMLGAVGYFSWRYVQNRGEDYSLNKDLLCYSLWVFLGVLIPSLYWDHYTIILIIPQAIILSAILKSDDGLLKKGFALMIWILCAILICWMFPFLHEAYHSGWRIIVLSHKLIATVVLFGLNWIYFMKN